MGRRKLPRPRCEVCGTELRGRTGRWCVRHANAAHGFGAHHSAGAAALRRRDLDRAGREALERERARQQQEGQHDG